MKEETKNESGRRNFFKKLSLGILGAFVIGYLPFKFLKRSNHSNKIKIQIHPSAVKRTNKV
ncbi:MAG: hypothetical protein V1720_16675 [bacterium]